MSKGKPLGRCPTCRSEIIATVNDGVFQADECACCERGRYESQADLLYAAELALAEIEQWDEVMGGSEAPRTQEAIETLRDAIDKAHHVVRPTKSRRSTSSPSIPLKTLPANGGSC